MPYIPHTSEDTREMLSAIGAESIGELFADIPKEVLAKGDLGLPEARTEDKLEKLICRIAGKNIPLKNFNSFLGAGLYEHFTPAIVHYVASMPEFYTAYTPYQPEVSQGTLQAIYEYQTFICLLTGMDVTCASLYDGASSLAEAVLMAMRIKSRRKILISSLIHPEYKMVLNTYLKNLDAEIEEIPFSSQGRTDWEKAEINADICCVVAQRPNFLGIIEDLTAVSQKCRKADVLLVEAVNPLSLSVLKSSAELGVDIVCGDGQALGQGMNFGGPSFGFLASKKEFVRKIPGRIVGRTTDRDGRQGFVLTLQAREQHIRRNKATSNICSNQSLNTLMASVYLASLGRKGFRNVGENCLRAAYYLKQRIEEIPGVKIPFSAPFFNEFVIELEKSAEEVYDALLERGIIAGLKLAGFFPEMKNRLLLAVTETKTKEEIDSFCSNLEEVLGRI